MGPAPVSKNLRPEAALACGKGTGQCSELATFDAPASAFQSDQNDPNLDPDGHLFCTVFDSHAFILDVPKMQKLFSNSAALFPGAEAESFDMKKINIKNAQGVLQRVLMTSLFGSPCTNITVPSGEHESPWGRLLCQKICALKRR